MDTIETLPVVHVKNKKSGTAKKIKKTHNLKDVEYLKGRFIITLTGGVLLFLRFINRLLGFMLFFTGIWVIGLSRLLVFMLQASRNNYWLDYGTGETVVNLIIFGGYAVAILIFISNVNKLFAVMPDNRLKRFIASFINRDYRPEREGNNIPSNMLKFNRKDTGFFFGTKLKGGIFGFYSNFYYVGKPTDADGHVVVVGGAGSGKSSCIAIPTLETWQGSIYAIDIKGELSDFYAKMDKPDKRPYIIFDPTNNESIGYDPYYLLRNSTEGDLSKNAKELAMSIIPVPPDIKDPFWIETAQNILAGAILYYFDMGCSFSQTIDEILDNPVEDLIEDIMNSETRLARKVVGTLRKAKHDQISSFATTLSNGILVFATDPLIYNILDKKEEDCFRIDDFETNIFIRLPEDKIDQWKPLITLMNNQRRRAYERRPDKTTPEGKEITPTLMLIDEFARFGKLEEIPGALTTLRSKGVTAALFIQSLAQLDYLYGKDMRRTIFDNCAYIAILNVTDPDSQEYFTRLTGTSEVEKKGQSISYDPDSGIEVSSSNNFSLRREPIVFPHEFAKLKDIVLKTPEGFCRVDKEAHFNRDKHHELKNPPMKITDVTDPIVEKIPHFDYDKQDYEAKKISSAIKVANIANLDLDSVKKIKVRVVGNEEKSKTAGQQKKYKTYVSDLTPKAKRFRLILISIFCCLLIFVFIVFVFLPGASSNASANDGNISANVDNSRVEVEANASLESPLSEQGATIEPTPQPTTRPTLEELLKPAPTVTPEATANPLDALIASQAPESQLTAETETELEPVIDPTPTATPTPIIQNLPAHRVISFQLDRQNNVLWLLLNTGENMETEYLGLTAEGTPHYHVDFGRVSVRDANGQFAYYEYVDREVAIIVPDNWVIHTDPDKSEVISGGDMSSLIDNYWGGTTRESRLGSTISFEIGTIFIED